jgi:hypothetical protein
VSKAITPEGEPLALPGAAKAIQHVATAAIVNSLSMRTMRTNVRPGAPKTNPGNP